MIPFIEKIVGDYLRSLPEVEEIAGDRVATKTPTSLSEPWVRITLLDDPPTGRSSADHLIAFYLQLDCHAGKDGSQSLASRLARTVREALGEIADHSHVDTVVSGSKVHSSKPLRDDDMPEIDRYVVVATVWAYSTEEGS